MARMARIVVPGIPHHVTQRGNRRQQTFFSQSDYAAYLSMLARYCACKKTEVWAYCLMPNHVHLVMVPSQEDGLRSVLAETHKRYTRIINAREGWQGHLWQERFHSFPMDESYLLAAARYIELNPVASGLCRRAEEWPWSSAAAHLEGRDDELIRVKPMLSRVPDWNRYLTDIAAPGEYQRIRLHGRTGRPLGSETFADMLEGLTGRELRPGRRGPKPRQGG